MQVEEHISKMIAILGTGITGISVAKFLLSRNLDFIFVNTCPKKSSSSPDRVTELFPTHDIFCGPFDDYFFQKIHTIVVSPGVPRDIPLLLSAREHFVRIIGDLELFFKAVSSPIVTITGANGKSTVTSLVGAMAEQASIKVGIGGNIGTPMLDLVGKNFKLYVLELSSFQLELFEGTGEHICGFLNISPDHLDRHGSMENYLAAKQHIFLGAKQAVVNRDDPLTFPQGLTCCDLVTFGTDEPRATDFGVISHNDIRWLALGKQRLMPVCDLSLKGTHNISNALAALALGHCAGLPMESMLSTLRHFRGLPHRCEEIACINNILYIDDSKATNIGAACAAIEGFSQFQKRNILLIAGGRTKNIDFSSLIKMVSTAVKHCFLLGEIADELHNLLGGVTPVSRHSSIEACVLEASKIGCAGDVVLLSPACASFDMFENYIERGLHFQAAVNSLSENGRAS